MKKNISTTDSVQPKVSCPKCRTVGTLQHMVFRKFLQTSVYEVVLEPNGEWEDGDLIEVDSDDGEPDGDCYKCPDCDTFFNRDEDTGKFLELDMCFQPIPGKEFDPVNPTKGPKTESKPKHQFWD